ncbi:uncharacterized protein LOC143448677 isoform X3 [Clavelina lepadiformis]|uniref:uncharacterized protein LOC143448677 isoform X3 n=1 Tax=Clavelina lepadiformis TaxID=159417 RepID=UPI00404206A0
MSSQVQYYGGRQMNRPPAGNYNDGYMPENRPYQPAQDYQGNRNSWSDRRAHEAPQQSNQQFNDGPAYQQDQREFYPQSASPPRRYDDGPHYQQRNEDYARDNRHDQRYPPHSERQQYDGNENRYNSHQEQKSYDQDNRGYDDKYRQSTQHRDVDGYQQEDYNSNLPQRVQQMNLNEPIHHQQRNYDEQYQRNPPTNYGSPPKREPHLRSDQYQSGPSHQFARDDYKPSNYEQKQPEREERSGPHTQPYPYDSPNTASQMSSPQVLAQTTSNAGGGAAVFGVVAKVNKPPDHRSPPPNLRSPADYPSYNQQDESRIRSPHSNPTRSHPLTTIMEQPNQISNYPDNKARYGEHDPQHYHNPPSHDRPYQEPQNPRNDQYYDRSAPLQGGHDMHRDTDSSGYGSVYTERSYDARPRDPPYSQHPPHGAPISPRAEQSASYNRPFDQPNSRDDSRGRRYENDQHGSSHGVNEHSSEYNQQQHKPAHWTMQKDAHQPPYRSQKISNQRWNEHDSGVDSSQIKSVRSMKNMFDKPSASVPLPQASSSWGANRYNNAGPAMSKPPTSPSSNQSYQTKTPYPPATSDHPRHQQPSHHHRNSYQEPSQRPDDRFPPPPGQNYPEQRYKPPSQPPSHQPPPDDKYERPRENFRERMPAPPQAQHPPPLRYDDGGQHRNQNLPHYDPPPQHSQSMNNLDVLNSRMRSPTNLDDPRARSSYSGDPPMSNPMVVGVQFQKKEFEGPDRGYKPLPPPVKPVNQHPGSGNRYVISHNQPQYEEQFQYDHSADRRYYSSAPPSSEPQSQRRQPYDDRRSPQRPPHNQATSQYKQPSYQQRSDQPNQFNTSNQPEGPSSDESNYVPSLVARSYQKFNSPSISDHQQSTRSQEPYQSQPPHHRQQPFNKDRPPYQQPHEDQRVPPPDQLPHSEQPLYGDRQPTYNQRRSPDTNYVPAVVSSSYNVYKNGADQSQNDEDWPAPPSDLSEQPRQTNHQPHHNNGPQYPQQQQQQKRQPPTGRDSNLGMPKAPRHPFDPPPDEDDSSEGIDVDAPTPPPTNRQQNLVAQRAGGPTYRPQVGRERNWGPSGPSRPIPAGERYGQDSRQPGDGLNEDRFTSTNQPQQHIQQRNVGMKPQPPQKPVRNSLRKKANNEQDGPDAVDAAMQDWDNTDAHPLNHDHSKDRVRMARTGQMSKRKPPTRMSSSTALVDDYAINVTPDDLVQNRISPITVEESQAPKPEKHHAEAKLTTSKKYHSQQPSRAEQPPRSADKPNAKKDNKLVFKVPSEEALKRGAASLPNIQETANDDRKRPPTYTGFGNTTKQKTSLGTDLLDKFKTAQESAIRSAQKKQDRALKSVQAITRLNKRSPSPVKSPTRPVKETRQDKNADIIKEATKRNDNRDIYNKSKPRTSHRESPDESDRSNSQRGRDDRPDRGRSRAKSKERGVSPDRRGRSRSRERNISPQHRGRSRSRERNISPERRGRDRSRDRDLDRDHRARKSERDRDRYHQQVSPYKQGHDDPSYSRNPYRRSGHHHSDEPDWVGEFRKKRAHDEPGSRRAWVNDPRWKDRKKEFDINKYERDVRSATAYNSDFEQPERKQMFPTKLMAKGAPPSRRPQQGGDDWMRNLKEHNRRANRNRY